LITGNNLHYFEVFEKCGVQEDIKVVGILDEQRFLCAAVATTETLADVSAPSNHIVDT
jgi:hypothetical protein